MHAFRSLRCRSRAPLTVAAAGLWASSSRFERCDKIPRNISIFPFPPDNKQFAGLQKVDSRLLLL